MNDDDFEFTGKGLRDRHNRTFTVKGHPVTATTLSVLDGGVEVQSAVRIITDHADARQFIMGAMVRAGKFEFFVVNPITMHKEDVEEKKGPEPLYITSVKPMLATQILAEVAKQVDLLNTGAAPDRSIPRGKSR